MMYKQKKTYEAPTTEVYRLSAQEDVLALPTVSDGGFGFDDDGPEDLRRSSGE